MAADQSGWRPTCWDDAIRDAESEIRRLEKKIAGLQSSVLVFQRNKKENVPFPGRGLSRKRALVTS